jgi:2-polyprenyl-3-methyl-5-hydroxy-6-metoxy-1,4-benzoquinol methylase
MMDRGGARRGGMPLYKFVGNKILTTVENAAVGLDLSEWHSGYRAYSVEALSDVPFHKNSDGFDFDTQVIIQLAEASKRITEVPIPTYYGDEVSRVEGLRYAADVTKWSLRYRAHKMGFGTGELAFASNAYEAKDDDGSSHSRLVGWLEARQPCRILDLGSSDGSIAAALRVHGHEVTAVDIEEHPGVRDRVHKFVQADLEQGIPDEVGDGYDVILAADVLEHVRNPEALLTDATARLAPGGSILTSVPNFAHWYPRLRVALGRFDYDRRGILDRGHVRFFTRRSFERLVDRVGLRVRRREAVGLPVDVASRGSGDGGIGSVEGGRPGAVSAVQRLDHVAVSVWPTLFAYQFLYALEPDTVASTSPLS